MKGKWMVGVVIGSLAVYPAIGYAAEHGGKEHAGQATSASQEHGGKEHGGTAATQEHAGQIPQVPPTAEQLRQSIRDYIARIEEEAGAFTIEDEVAGGTRTLTLERVHERVGKTGDFYYSCTDMRDASTNELLDLDFDVEEAGSELNVVDVRIHKVNGQARYTYDDKDNRIPLL